MSRMWEKSSIGGLSVTMQPRDLLEVGDMVIELVDIKGGQIRITINADKKIPIKRVRPRNNACNNESESED